MLALAIPWYSWYWNLCLGLASHQIQNLIPWPLAPFNCLVNIYKRADWPIILGVQHAWYKLNLIKFACAVTGFMIIGLYYILGTCNEDNVSTNSRGYSERRWILSITYKTLQYRHPSYIHDLLQIQYDTSTRSSTTVTLKRPAVPSGLEITDKSFTHTGLFTSHCTCSLECPSKRTSPTCHPFFSCLSTWCYSASWSICILISFQA